jgi:AcrR family transcriptional regulator
VARTTKEPEIRKTELVDAALELFNTNGYEKTTISDIVKKVGVAQGLFYYYFKNKEEVLNEIVERYIVILTTNIKNIKEKADLSPQTKLERIFNFLFSVASEQEVLALYIHQEANINTKLEDKMMRELIPLLGDIIQQGVSEGVFDTLYPYETGAVILSGVNTLFKFQEYVSNSGLMEDRNTKVSEDIIAKMLGLPKESFRIKEHI